MKPWVKLYREERGTFAQLPLVCRGIAMEILKLTDDAGVIRIGRKPPVDAIAFALGATRSDRRALAQYVPMLLEDGFLVHEGDRLIVPNFPRFQSDDRASTTPRTNHEATTKTQRPSNEPTATEQRTNHETEAKTTESFGGTDLALSEIREDKSREDLPPPTSSAPAESVVVVDDGSSPEPMTDPMTDRVLTVGYVVDRFGRYLQQETGSIPLSLAGSTDRTKRIARGVIAWAYEHSREDPKGIVRASALAFARRLAATGGTVNGQRVKDPFALWASSPGAWLQEAS